MLALKEKYEGKVEFVVADVNSPEGNSLAGQFSVDLIPAIFIIDGKGNLVRSEVGEQPQAKLESYLDDALKSK